MNSDSPENEPKPDKTIDGFTCLEVIDSMVGNGQEAFKFFKSWTRQRIILATFPIAASVSVAGFSTFGLVSGGYDLLPSLLMASGIALTTASLSMLVSKETRIITQNIIRQLKQKDVTKVLFEKPLRIKNFGKLFTAREILGDELYDEWRDRFFSSLHADPEKIKSLSIIRNSREIINKSPEAEKCVTIVLDIWKSRLKDIDERELAREFELIKSRALEEKPERKIPRKIGNPTTLVTQSEYLSLFPIIPIKQLKDIAMFILGHNPDIARSFLDRYCEEQKAAISNSR